ncbi:MAG: SMP-30/gluconolactonase/LRE family protein [Rhizobiales bacterium]|nr:SMP-30/gluconolactonase/LRE family protein [Hyphomicrobiales bacterium]
MNRLVLAVLAALIGIGGAKAQTPPAIPPINRGPIIAPAAALETLFTEGFWLEGPTAGPDGRIYFSDVTMTFRTGNAAGNIWVYDPASGRTSLFRSPSGMANGIKFDASGGMVVAQGADFGGRAIIRIDMATGRAKILAGLYKGRPFNAPNDLDIDGQGRIYFTDPRYFGHEPIEQPVNGVYRIDPDGSVRLVLADITRPNGIALSPDGRRLYVAEHDFLVADRRIDPVPQRNGAMHILVYDLGADGMPVNRRVLVDFGAEQGADGLAVDSAGNIYAAVQAASRFGVRVYDPEGREIAYVPTPTRPTNVALATSGGRSHLYVTGGPNLYRIEALSRPRQAVVRP